MEIRTLLEYDDRTALRRWLLEHHQTEREVWVATYRGKQPIADALPYVEVVEEALCFGWIDSTCKRLPDGRFAQRLSPRRKNSHWTEYNKERCRELEQRGLMTEAGRQAMPILKREYEVVAAIIRREERLFATQRGYGEWKDWWEFPGGKMEPGESAEEALRREIREELSTEISVDKLLCTVEYDYPKFHLTMHCFLCSLLTDALHLNEHEDARWLAREELDSVQWLPADLQLIEQLKNIDLW